MMVMWLVFEFWVCFQASPDNATSQQKQEFQSEILLSAMEIFHVMSGSDMSMFRGEWKRLAFHCYDTELLTAEQKSQHVHQPWTSVS